MRAEQTVNMSRFRPDSKPSRKVMRLARNPSGKPGVGLGAWPVRHVGLRHRIKVVVLFAGGAAGPREVEDDPGVVFGALAIHDHDAAEKQAAGVGNDGGAAGRDAALGEQEDDLGEQVVDLLGSLELGGLAAGWLVLACPLNPTL